MNTNETMQAALPTDRRAARAGTRAWALCAILLAILIVVNVLVSLLPATLTSWDTTENGLYTVSDTTKRLLSSLDEEVTIYVLSPNGRQDDMPGRLLERYEAASRRIKVKVIDPVADANLLADCKTVDPSALATYSMVVVSDLRYTVVDFSSARYYQVEGLGPVPAAQYEQLASNTEILYYYYQYYGINLTQAVPYYGLEEQLTQAIEYVSAPIVPHMYVWESSRPIGSMLTSFVDLIQPEREVLDISGEQPVPAEAAPLLIYAPVIDLSDAATERLLTYIANGGKIVLVTSQANAAMPNLARVTSAFGVLPLEGVVCEGNANSFVDTPTALLANVNAEHTVTSAFASYGKPLCPNAHAIVTVPERSDALVVTELLTTSASAYLRQADGKETTLGKTAIGVAVENTQTGASLFWLSSIDALDDEFIQANSQTSTAIFHVAMAIDWLGETYTSTLDAIEPVNMTETPMNVTDSVLIVLGALLVVAVPGALLISGIVIRVRRSRR